MNEESKLADIRREYGKLALNDTDIERHPISFFKQWFSEIIEVEYNDPTAMTLSSVDEKGHPDSRVVLLKGIEDDNFIFYTNYESNKAQQFASTPFVALNFYWPVFARQVRIKGTVQRTSRQLSDEYFSSRPRDSQLSAIASAQSKPLANRKTLEDIIEQLMVKYHDTPIQRPENWGGYTVCPETIEFWQGRDNRLHDRILYTKKNNKWCNQRLFP